jgi:DUF971 family protein
VNDGPWPRELRLLSAEKILEVEFEDGRIFRLPAELLRVESPSAEVRGHGASTKQIVHGKRHVAITAIEQVGNYAVRLVFDDRHDSGIFSWSYLRELGENQERVWADYLAALAARGLTRDGA